MNKTGHLRWLPMRFRELFPSPLRGGARGGGVGCERPFSQRRERRQPSSAALTPPLPTLSPQGGEGFWGGASAVFQNTDTMALLEQNVAGLGGSDDEGGLIAVGHPTLGRCGLGRRRRGGSRRRRTG